MLCTHLMYIPCNLGTKFRQIRTRIAKEAEGGTGQRSLLCEAGIVIVSCF